jgi:hypothetical protein
MRYKLFVLHRTYAISTRLIVPIEAYDAGFIPDNIDFDSIESALHYLEVNKDKILHGEYVILPYINLM